MAKKAGMREFDWERELKDPKCPIEKVTKLIDGWLFTIGHKDDFDVSIFYHEIIAFINVIRDYGYLGTLPSEYKERYLQIVRFQKETWEQKIF